MPKTCTKTAPAEPRLPRLLDALESRLDALTSGLEHVDVTGKGIDLIKEIKELHAILHSLRQDETTKSAPTLTVVWGNAPSAPQMSAHNASQTRAPRGSGRRTASKSATAPTTSGQSSASGGPRKTSETPHA